jgi:Domain of unknown function (DUF1707)
MLVGDRTRDLGVRALRRHFVSGRLSEAELADRVELALRARKREDLADAMEGLPPVWEDLPVGVHTAAHHVRRGFRRVGLFFRFVRVWFKVNLALILVFGLALAVGAPVGRTLGAAAAAWVLASFGVWLVWRRATAPSAVRVVARRK